MIAIVPSVLKVTDDCVESLVGHSGLVRHCVILEHRLQFVFLMREKDRNRRKREREREREMTVKKRLAIIGGGLAGMISARGTYNTHTHTLITRLTRISYDVSGAFVESILENSRFREEFELWWKLESKARYGRDWSVS